MIFWNDKGETFTIAADFMGTNWLIRTIEIGLFALLFLHIFEGLYLWYTNSEKRKARYEKTAGNTNSTWYSRSMGLLGTLLLLFLILHLSHFWIESRLTDKITSGESTLFNEMKLVFKSPIIVLAYLAGCASLAYHLLHGFQSAFQSLGINHKAYNGLIHQTGVAFSIVIPTIFAAMPVSMYLGWIK